MQPVGYTFTTFSINELILYKSSSISFHYDVANNLEYQLYIHFYTDSKSVFNFRPVLRARMITRTLRTYYETPQSFSLPLSQTHT